DRTSLPANAQIDDLDEYRKPQREVYVALRNVHVETVADERDSDEEQERQREDLERGMPLNETADRAGRHHHDHHSQHNSGDHDLEILRHPDGRNHRVERKHDVEEHDLHDDRSEGRRRTPLAMVLGAFESVMDLEGGLREQKQSAGDQDEIAT